MNKLKIVHIIPELVHGGAQMLLADLARHTNILHDVTVISLFAEGDLVLDGVKVIYLKKKNGFHLKTFFDLYLILRHIKPDIVHTHLYAALYAVPWFFVSKKRRGVHTIHSSVKKEFGRIHRYLQKILYKYRNVTPVAISNTILNQVLDEYNLPRDKAALIYNAIDVEKFTNNIRDFNKDDITIIQVATFNPWKNQKLLLDAFKIAYEKNNDLKLFFVGDGPDRKDIVKLTQEYGLCDCVVFVGKSFEVEKWLAKADIFALSSMYEGLPISVLEAFASGLPVISTDVGGVRDVVEDGINGLIVDPNNKKLFADAILKLASNKQLRIDMSKENIKKSYNYDIQKAVGLYLELYMKR